MNRNDIIQNASKNKAALLASTLIAKAVIRLPNGTVRILSVYDKSTRYEFYWAHETKAKSQRASRKGWSRPQPYTRDFTTDYKPYVSFQTFVAWYTSKESGTLLSLRVYKARRLAALYAKTDHEACVNDWNWSASMNSADPANYRKMNQRLDAHIEGRVVDNSWRG